jgi:hypothetical protein
MEAGIVWNNAASIPPHVLRFERERKPADETFPAGAAKN